MCFLEYVICQNVSNSPALQMAAALVPAKAQLERTSSAIRNKTECCIQKPEMMELVSATNMTEQFAALGAIAQNAGDARDEVLSDFYQKWKEDALVITKWLALQVVSDILGNVKNVQRLLEHLAVDIRKLNKVYSDGDDATNGFGGVSSDEEAQDDRRVRNISVRTGVLDEKAAATQAIGLFALHKECIYTLL